MLLDDERILSIGMISLAMGILIGRFLHFEYAGFAVRFCGRSPYWVISGNELNVYDKKKKKIERILFLLHKHSSIQNKVQRNRAPKKYKHCQS